MTIDPIRRAQLRAHHSATHLLHEALRRHLGEHVTQKGSLVAPDRLRFDISHPKPISLEELRRVEDEVNERIRRNTAVETRLMTPEEAIAAGAMALFGEKYGEEVRVLSMGGEHGETYSVELCGGTHARAPATSACSRSSARARCRPACAASRRWPAPAAEEHARRQADLLARGRRRPEGAARGAAGAPAGAGRGPAPASSASWPTRRKALALAGGGDAGAAAADEVREVGGVKLIGRVLNGVPAKDLKGMADEIKQKLGSGVVALVGVERRQGRGWWSA